MEELKNNGGVYHNQQERIGPAEADYLEGKRHNPYPSLIHHGRLLCCTDVRATGEI